MKTAEMTIEHVLAGILVICAFVLPFAPASSLSVLDRTEVLFGSLGAAYLLGVVFDKVADTVLGPFEQWSRLNLASKWLEEGRQQGSYAGDPFPQDGLEFALRGDGDGRVAWMNSLRSRIRTARELAVYGLPAALGLAIREYRLTADCAGGDLNAAWWLNSAVVINAVLLASSLWIQHRHKMPRTVELSGTTPEREKVMGDATKSMWINGVPYILILFVSALCVGYVAICLGEFDVVAAIGVFGTAGAVCAFWVWWRISLTHMKFVQQRMSEYMRDSLRP